MFVKKKMSFFYPNPQDTTSSIACSISNPAPDLPLEAKTCRVGLLKKMQKKWYFLQFDPIFSEEARKRRLNLETQMMLLA